MALGLRFFVIKWRQSWKIWALHETSPENHWQTIGATIPEAVVAGPDSFHPLWLCPFPFPNFLSQILLLSLTHGEKQQACQCFLRLILFICVRACACMCIYYIYVGACEARRGLWILWSLDYRVLWATWVLGTELVYAFKCWAISPAPYFRF